MDPRQDQGHSKSVPEESLASLVRLLDVLESFQVSLIWVLTLALGFLCLSVAPGISCVSRFLVRRRGRAPPALWAYTQPLLIP